ncbi:MAG TPA: hypothetical protein VME46_05380 [Acidimicrobiales bacterium]|nr:hypothetical protein [Acidimicrobiales bacterium]
MGSYLLRLVERARLQGRVAGTAEILGTGEVVAVRNAQELLAVLLAPSPVASSAVAGVPDDEPGSTDKGNAPRS